MQIEIKMTHLTDDLCYASRAQFVLLFCQPAVLCLLSIQ